MKDENLTGRPIGRPRGSVDLCSSARRPVTPESLVSWIGFRREFGERLRQLRTERNIAADELGAAVGLTRSAILSYERGCSVPPVRVLAKLAYALFCSVVDLMPERAHHV
jgi:DNA-binding XRE family transcriptional regulator